LETNVVANAVLPQCAVEAAMKFTPFSVSVNCAPPGATDTGEILVMYGTGWVATARTLPGQSMNNVVCRAAMQMNWRAAPSFEWQPARRCGLPGSFAGRYRWDGFGAPEVLVKPPLSARDGRMALPVKGFLLTVASFCIRRWVTWEWGNPLPFFGS
jgi:hypothetical protein